MNEQLEKTVEKINALSLRERLMILVTIVVLCGFGWWNFFALPILDKTKELSQKNKSL